MRRFRLIGLGENQAKTDLRIKIRLNPSENCIKFSPFDVHDFDAIRRLLALNINLLLKLIKPCYSHRQILSFALVTQCGCQRSYTEATQCS